MEQQKVKVLFIHHSTGNNLIRHGKLRDHIYKLSDRIEFWDHSYNLYKTFPPKLKRFLAKFTHHSGLTDSQGNYTGKDYQIFLNNNNPKDYAAIFSKDPKTDPTLSNILKYDVIAFKKCFPTSQIISDEQLEDYKHSFLKIRDFVDKHPDKVFIVVTQPPLRREVTNTENAKRARKLADYLWSSEYLGNRNNLKCFNFFDLLADSNDKNRNTLKRNYIPWFYRDSHPNKLANLQIAGNFANSIVNIACEFYNL